MSLHQTIVSDLCGERIEIIAWDTNDPLTKHAKDSVNRLGLTGVIRVVQANDMSVYVWFECDSGPHTGRLFWVPMHWIALIWEKSDETESDVEHCPGCRCAELTCNAKDLPAFEDYYKRGIAQ